ncbi:MAG: ribonuclease E/G, partial [Gammaproteobacteria bacterium]|nr:ribonuclease E/G [Gammaproteobacteria bacterium]
IDFIDMGPNRNQREVENRLREAVKTDRARVQIGRISRFGLLEMSRQRMRRSLGESANQICPRCNGQAVIRSIESLALAVLRLVGEEARKERTSKVIAELPIDVATFLLNEKREWIHNIEENTEVELLLVSNPALETPNYTIRRVRDDQTLMPENSGASYNLITPEGDLLEEALKLSTKSTSEIPAVSGVTPDSPAPTPKAPVDNTQSKKVAESAGIAGFFKKLFGNDAVGQPEEKPASQRSGKRQSSRRGGKRDTRSRRGQGERRSGRSGSSQGKRSDNNSDSRSGQKDSAQKPRQQQNKQQNKQQASGEDKQGSGRKRRRRRRSSNRNKSGDNAGNQQQAQNNAGPDSDNAGNSAARNEQPNERVQTRNQNSDSRQSDNKAADIKPTDTKAAGNKPAAKPQSNDKDGNRSDGNRSDGNRSNGNGKDGGKDRLLPWESAPGQAKQSYTVWSSDESGD